MTRFFFKLNWNYIRGENSKVDWIVQILRFGNIYIWYDKESVWTFTEWKSLILKYSSLFIINKASLSCFMVNYIHTFITNKNVWFNTMSIARRLFLKKKRKYQISYDIVDNRYPATKIAEKAVYFRLFNIAYWMPIQKKTHSSRVTF